MKTYELSHIVTVNHFPRCAEIIPFPHRADFLFSTYWQLPFSTYRCSPKYILGYLVFSWMLFFSLEQSVSDQAFPPFFSFPHHTHPILYLANKVGDLPAMDWKGIVYFPSYTQEKIPAGIFCNLRRGICSRSAVGWRGSYVSRPSVRRAAIIRFESSRAFGT